MHATLQDLRFALRQLRKSPGFALTAILTLALGIGATTAMYSIVRGTLLAPLPYPHAEELVGLGFSQPADPPYNGQTGESANLIQSQAKSFASMGIADSGPLGANLSTGTGAAQSIHSLRVSSTYLPTLGVAPILGHTFTAAEDLPHASPTILLSETLWHNTFNADPYIVGKTVHLNEDPYTVIGVMPSRFATVDSPDTWTPLHLSADDPGYQGTNYQMIARLKPGLTLPQAAAEMPSLTAAIYRAFPTYTQYVNPGEPLMRQTVLPLHDIVVSNARPSLIALSAAVLAVLLLACLNLAGLMTARSIARRSEIALRSALGASRAATLRLLLSESLLLAIAGSLFGLSFAAFVVPLLVKFSPIDTTQIHAPALDPSAALFAILTGCATTLLFGLIPALTVLRRSIGSHIANTRSAGDTASHQRLGKSLIIAQVALATTMLSAGALLLSAFLHMRSIPSGIRPQHLYSLEVNLKGDAYASSTHTTQFIANVEARLRQIPGVASVATVNGLPLQGGLNASAGPAAHPDQIHNAELRFVTPGYFTTSGMTILSGNDISASDTATTQPVALIDDAAARRWFPNQNPIGQSIIALGKNPRRVIGITAGAHSRSLADIIRPTAFLPLTQISDTSMKMINGWFPTNFVIRTISRPNTPDPDIARAATAAIASVDPDVPSTFAPIQSLLDKDVAAPRFFSWLAGAFAAFALLLTVVGLFGLLSYQVTSRTRELGVRMALGAQRNQILTLILSNGLTLTAIGLALGIAASFALRGVIASLLYTTIDGVGRDSATSLLGNRSIALTIAAAAMLLSTIAASLIPAHRASQLEPTEALRSE
jgi:predicted permease